MRRTSKGGTFEGLARGAGLALTVLLATLTAGCMSAWPGWRDRPRFLPEEDLKTYEMRQRAWTLGDQFVILQGEDRRPAFWVKGRAFSIGDKLSFCDDEGNELATIAQKVLSLRPNYRILRRGAASARVVKRLTFFRRSFVVDVPGDDDYRVRGDFWNYEYVFTRGDRTVAMVAKWPFAWPDAYRITIAAGEDDVLILAAAVVIDLVEHDDEDSSACSAPAAEP